MAGFEATLAPDHANVIRARANLAVTLVQMGELQRARELEESVLAARERTQPADHPDRLLAQANLANTVRQMGDLSRARALFEAALSGYERTVPPEHPHRLRAQRNLAVLLYEMGDLPAARVLGEETLAIYQRALPADHLDVLRAQGNLANTLREMGELQKARSIEEELLQELERNLPADNPELLAVRLNLATTLTEMGELAAAHALQEQVLTTRQKSLPPHHPDRLLTQVNSAAIMRRMGDLQGSRALAEKTLASYRLIVLPDHPSLLRVMANLATTLHEMGDRTGALQLASELVTGMRDLALSSLSLAPREAREAVAAEAHRFSSVLHLTHGDDSDLQARVFELQETMRMVVCEAARTLGLTHDREIENVLDRAHSIRQELNNLAVRPLEDSDSARRSAEFARLTRERDALERTARKRLAERGVVTQAVEVERLAEALEDDSALITYRRVAQRDQAQETLLAHVLRSDGALRRVDLGPAPELEALVEEWRAALGTDFQVRGVVLEEQEERSDREVVAGAALRAKLLGPVLAELEESTRRLFVCADDLVFLVPLDALPHHGGRVGDRWSIANEVSCGRLMVSSQPSNAGPTLLALGGVDYGTSSAHNQASGGSNAGRNGLPERFSRLSQTGVEVRAAEALFKDLSGGESVVLTKESTTKVALFEHAPGKRYVHLATHGWFAADTIKSTLDSGAGSRRGTPMSLEDRVTGMAPMLLCGLALTGANHPPDSRGRRPGILTAEELCSLDLSACDLAVLSACETNVGIRRAGQGIQSLQAALYAAGARSSITSLWKVDDAATRRLMELFYTNLWKAKMPKAEALWEAKRTLREEGAPVRDWAGWVLTGDPH